MPQNASAAEQASTDQKHKPRLDFDSDLEWLLDSGDSVLGARGTLAGVVSQCERGSVGGSGSLDAAGSYIHPYTDQQLGFGRSVGGEVERHRWLSTAWHALPEATHAKLLLRYMKPRAEFRSDAGYGAKHTWVKGTEPYGLPPEKRFGKHGKQVEIKQYERRLARWERARAEVQMAGRTTGVESLLGEFAALAFAIADDPVALLIACRQPHSTDSQKVRRRALDAAKGANLQAHAEWFESKDGADPMRNTLQRVGSGSRPGGVR